MMHVLLTILLLSPLIGVQVKHHPELPQEQPTGTVSPPQDSQYSQVLRILKKVEHGIRSSALHEFEGDLGAMVSLSISSEERGYFSMNQAASVIAKYFSIRRPISFTFSKIFEKGSTPYATGRFIYAQKGSQESAQVYIALTRQDSRWVIGQFNIY